MDIVMEKSGVPVPSLRGAAVHLNASQEIRTGKGVFPSVPSTSPSAYRYQPIRLSSQADLYSFTIIHPNPKTGLSPFALIYADFAEDTRVFGRLRLNEGERPTVGMRVKVAIDDGIIDVDNNYYFEPVGRDEK